MRYLSAALRHLFCQARSYDTMPREARSDASCVFRHMALFGSLPPSVDVQAVSSASATVARNANRRHVASSGIV